MTPMTMRACWYRKYGAAADVLEVGTLPVPEPEPGEVRVRIHVSAVNPGDLKARTGMRGGMPFDLIVPHGAGAGVVESVGSGVDAGLVGTRVWIHGAGYGRQWATGAEFSVIPAGQVVPLPDHVSFREGACLGVPALTAHRCLFVDGPVDGTTVLVVGASGSVGFCAVQLARWGGATVYAVTGAGRLEEVRAAGATAVFNRAGPDLDAAIAAHTGDRGVERIVAADFDLALQLAPRLLAPLGVITSFATPSSGTPALPFRDLMLRNATIQLVYLFGVPAAAKRQAVDDVTAALNDTGISCPIVGVYGLKDVVEAHETVDRPDTRGVALIELIAP